MCGFVEPFGWQVAVVLTLALIAALQLVILKAILGGYDEVQSRH